MSVTPDTDLVAPGGAHSGCPRPQGREAKGVTRMAEKKKISPKKSGSKSSSTSRTAATRVTKRRAVRKSPKRGA
jgi:hypothetical protein